jgi:hypothetical protein
VAPLGPALWLTAGSLVTASAVVAIAAARGAAGWAGPVFGGMVGPLVAVVATWVLVVGAYRRDPASVMGVAAAAFLAKLLFFAAYVAAAITLAGLPAREFGISFVAWFIALYAAQTVLMRRLFREGLKGARK